MLVARGPQEFRILSEPGAGACRVWGLDHSIAQGSPDGEVDLKKWPEVIQETDAQSVYDCLKTDATSTSSDKRMATEGALLRKNEHQPGAHLRWIDGMQNMANMLIKSNDDKETLKDCLRDCMIGRAASEANAKLKLRQVEQRLQEGREGLLLEEAIRELAEELEEDEGTGDH